MSPAVAFGKPDDFVRSGQITPVDRLRAGLELRQGNFFENVSNRAGRRVRDSQICSFVVARSRNESDFRAVGAPFGVREIVVAGARRTTGAFRGRTPGRLRFARKAPPDGAGA